MHKSTKVSAKINENEKYDFKNVYSCQGMVKYIHLNGTAWCILYVSVDLSSNERFQMPHEYKKKFNLFGHKSRQKLLENYTSDVVYICILYIYYKHA